MGMMFFFFFNVHANESHELTCGIRAWFRIHVFPFIILNVILEYIRIGYENANYFLVYTMRFLFKARMVYMNLK